MPKISLVVCLYKERDLLERLLRHAEGCYDDLVVVHDGPEEEPNSEWRVANGEECPRSEIGGHHSNPSSKIHNSSSHSAGEVFVPSHRWPGMAVDFSVPEEAARAAHFWKEKTGTPKSCSTHELVEQYGGRFFEGPRCWQQEPHWPFAWTQAKHDWILRLDADEFPSEELKSWLIQFKLGNVSGESGYLALWPPWDGMRVITKNIPPCRTFLFNRNRINFFGMVEHGPVFDSKPKALSLELVHWPTRKSIGPANLLLRKQAYIWRKVIALSLLKTPLELPRWQTHSDQWPPYWEQMRQRPIFCGINRCAQSVPREFLVCARSKYDFLPEAAVGTALHKFLVPLAFAYYRWEKRLLE